VVYYYYIHGNNKNGSYNNTSMIAPGDTGKLGTRISVISAETAHRNILVARRSRVQNGLEEWVCGILRYEILLLLIWLVASPWYRTAKCQPNSPCGNSKGKCSDGTFASLIRSNSPTGWCKFASVRLPYYRPSKMAATSLHWGYQLPGLTNRTFENLLVSHQFASSQ